MTFPVRPAHLQVLGTAPEVAPVTGAPSRRFARNWGPFAWYVTMTLALSLPVLASLVVAVEAWTIWAVLAVALAAPSLLWVAGGAASCLIGLFVASKRRPAAPEGWRPPGRMAILVLMCGEPPDAVAARIAALGCDLRRHGLGRHCAIFILSDTQGEAPAAAERAAFSELIRTGQVRYRRRKRNSGRKPGNIAQWFAAQAKAFETMLVLDSDSRMNAARIRDMAYRMTCEPRLGLLQAGLGLVPAHTRFGRMQRVSARLLGPTFAQGFAFWSGETANYWGHNALIRVQAFAEAVPLPRLSGATPLGGEILSHDFVEAAIIRGAGWDVVLDPDAAGSAEDGPQTLCAYHKRDRRWCQGNLQHVRLLAAPGFVTISRLHMASGVFSYLAGPIWLLLVVLMAGGLFTLNSVLPLLLVALLLLVPKLAGLWRLAGPRGTPWRRRVAVRAVAVELVVSSCLAPSLMLRHAMAICSVLARRDCGWKGPENQGPGVPAGWVEAGFGLALAAFAAWSDPGHLPWLLPVLGPLLAAPVLIPVLEATA